MSKVFLALQSMEETRAIVEAIKDDNPGVEVENQPAMVKISADSKMVINAQTVSDKIGRDWDPQELQLVLISLAGNVDEDYDHFTIYWEN
ncbi:MAG: MmoB/DmpM family protein [Campylobacterota bacterium]